MTSAIPFNTVLMQIPERTSSTQAGPGDLHDIVGNAFLTALLLTGSAELAEAAILEGHRAMDPDHLSEDALFRRAVNAAIEPQREPSEQPGEEIERGSAVLPFELRRVLRLPSALRHCFVLRFLVGLSREACARLLRLEIGQVDERARTAMLELPTIREEKRNSGAQQCAA